MNNLDFDEFRQIIRVKRLTGKWYFFIGIVEGKYIRLKGYNTWLQVYNVNFVDNSNPMERSVKEFNEDLFKPFKGDVNED